MYVAFKTLVVSQDNITGLEFFYKIFVVSFQSFFEFDRILRTWGSPLLMGFFSDFGDGLEC